LLKKVEEATTNTARLGIVEKKRDGKDSRKTRKGKQLNKKSKNPMKWVVRTWGGRKRTRKKVDQKRRKKGHKSCNTAKKGNQKAKSPEVWDPTILALEKKKKTRKGAFDQSLNKKKGNFIREKRMEDRGRGKQESDKMQQSTA